MFPEDVTRHDEGDDALNDLCACGHGRDEHDGDDKQTCILCDCDAFEE